LPDKCFTEIQNCLKNDEKELSVVAMPDFFIDRLVNLDREAEAVCRNISEIVGHKGGSIDGAEQTELRGGNAVNTTCALAALGVKVTPLVCTDELGLQLITFFTRSNRVDLSHAKTFNNPSLTTALEFKTEDGRANVMLRDLGALTDFGPNDLNRRDYEAIENADYVCVFNWAGTRRFGTELAETVFRRTKTNGRGKTYYDTADPTPNREKIRELVNTVLKSENVDILSVNENEAVCYAEQLGLKTKANSRNVKFEELAMDAARFLAKHLNARIDLHTTRFSATFRRKHETVVSAFDVPVLRATGAGDAWNAGNILGDAFKLSDECRLTLANAVAACYISNRDGTHPTRMQLTEFLTNAKTT